MKTLPCIVKVLYKLSTVRAIFMEDHVPIRPDRSLLFSRQNSKWSLWDVVLHENNSNLKQFSRPRG